MRSVLVPETAYCVARLTAVVDLPSLADTDVMPIQRNVRVLLASSRDVLTCFTPSLKAEYGLLTTALNATSFSAASIVPDGNARLARARSGSLNADADSWQDTETFEPDFLADLLGGSHNLFQAVPYECQPETYQ